MIKISLLIENENGKGTLTYDNVTEIHTTMSYITMEKTMFILYKENGEILKVAIPEKDIIGYDLTTNCEV